METISAIEKFKLSFPKINSLITAVHVSLASVLTNVEISFDNWADGVFLVDHGIWTQDTIAALKDIRKKFPDKWIGVNLLDEIFPNDVFDAIKWENVNGVRIDNPMLKYINPEDKSKETLMAQKEIWWNWLYFCGFNFKHQRQLETSEEIRLAFEHNRSIIDVLTTSGAWTWISADPSAVRKIVKVTKEYPIALASWVSSKNIRNFVWLVDAFIVATSISRDFYNLDPKKIRELAKIIDDYN